MLVKVLFGIAVGAAIGGGIGYAAKCTGGTCPLTCNPVGGMIVGALIGMLIASGISQRAAETYTPSPHFIHVESPDQLDELVRTNPVVLVDFGADWCAPCRRLKPTLHRIADTYAGRVVVAGVNVDDMKDAARAHGVSGIPDVRIFRNGEEVDRIVGARDDDAYTRRLDELLAVPSGA